MEKKARVIAFYLPQFHPMNLNDDWWGKGFTEWTNVAKARPLFRGHYQPRIPADLGFYDLRLPETREAQAKMAADAGIEGFCYWHYWLDKNTQLLDRPFNEVLKSGNPDFPFCLGWANHSWTNDLWSATNKPKLSLKQSYNQEEYERHFYDVLAAFKDKRYITVDGRPLFLVFDPISIPDPENFINTWQHLATQNGLLGIHFVGIVSNLLSLEQNFGGQGKLKIVNVNTPAAPRYNKLLSAGFDAVNSRGQYRAELIEMGKYKRLLSSALRRFLGINTLKVLKYENIVKNLFVEEDKWENVYPTILPNWDRSPRSGKEAIIYHGSTPERFRKHLKQAIDLLKGKKEEHRILFLMSWNEWGEGNYVEPDLQFGHGYLDVLKEEIND